MKRIAASLAFVVLAGLAYVCAHVQFHFGGSGDAIAAWSESEADPVVSNGIDGVRPPAAHVND